MIDPNLESLAKAISLGSGPSRDLDQEIAVAVGYEKTVGEQDGTRKSVWLSPDGQVLQRLPAFTGSVERAKQLADIVAPNHVAAITWGSSNRAVLDEEHPWEAATPALALCAAAIFRLSRKD